MPIMTCRANTINVNDSILKRTGIIHLSVLRSFVSSVLHRPAADINQNIAVHQTDGRCAKIF